MISHFLTVFISILELTINTIKKCSLLYFNLRTKTVMLVFVPVILLTGFLSFYLMAAIPFSTLDYSFSLVFISLSLSPEEVSCSYLSCSIRILICRRGSVCRGIRLSTVTRKGRPVGLMPTNPVDLLSKDKKSYTKGQELN